MDIFSNLTIIKLDAIMLVKKIYGLETNGRLSSRMEY